MENIAPNQKEICINLPPKVYSAGFWENIKSPSVLAYSLPLLHLQIILIFSITYAFHFFLKHFGAPIFISQLLAGLILGPPLLGSIDKFKEIVFPIESQNILGVVASLGYTLFLFLIGVKMDLGMVFKTGRKASVIGILSLAAPLTVGLIVEAAIEKSWLGKDVPDNLVLVTALLSLTPFPVIYMLLADLKILNSELGRLGLSAAMIGEAVSVGLTNIAILLNLAREASLQVAFFSLGGTIGFIGVVIFAFRPVMVWMVKQTPKGRPVDDIYIYVIVLMVLVSGLLTHSFGQEIFFGPFILGLAIPDGPPLGSALVEKLDCWVSGIFLPLFVTTSVMRADFGSLMSRKNLIIIDAILTVVTLIAKIGACLIASLCCKMPLNDSVALALIMSCKGIVELAGYSSSRDNQVITQETYAMLIIGVLITACIVPIIMNRLYDPSRKYAGYQRRNIMHMKPNSEFRILVCIHGPDNITAAINLLDASGPTPETPIYVYILHLIKLIGRASPIFISHRIQMKKLSTHSYSETVLLSFSQYQQKNTEVVSVDPFTAISPTELMHEDICMLALDKLTSLIVLPFHRNWTTDGSIISEDTTIRAINCSVLERAPCSIGILVNRRSRRHQKSEQSCRVAMIFFGGNDDREGLAFAKFMAKKSSTSLTVVHIVEKHNKEIVSWEQMLDSETMKDVKTGNVGSGNVKYQEEVARSGPETECILRKMVGIYDLIIVGRRNNTVCPHTTGLSDWSEFPELGLIGDLLASPDFNCKASILVIQQQQQLT